MSSLRFIKQVDMNLSAHFIDVNNVFSADFDFYRVIVSNFSVDGTGATGFYWRLLNSAGTMQVNDQYEYAHRSLSGESTTVTDTGQTSQTSWENIIAPTDQVPDTAGGFFDFLYPFDNNKDTIIFYGTASSQQAGILRNRTGGGRYYAPSYNSFTGFRIFPHSTTNNNNIVSGQILVFGYRNA